MLIKHVDAISWATGLTADEEQHSFSCNGAFNTVVVLAFSFVLPGDAELFSCQNKINNLSRKFWV